MRFINEESILTEVTIVKSLVIQRHKLYFTILDSVNIGLINLIINIK